MVVGQTKEDSKMASTATPKLPKTWTGARLAAVVEAAYLIEVTTR